MMLEETLDRHELPIQCVEERDNSCYAIVPVHLRIFDLSSKVRTDPGILSGSRETLREWYNEDMVYYLDCLRREGTALPWLRGYGEFDESWRLGSYPETNGFLRLWFKNVSDQHDSSDHYNTIGLLNVSVVLHNHINESREFYTPEICKQMGWPELIYKRSKDPEAISLSPGKMRKYGTESQIARIDEKRGVAEVLSQAFLSPYLKNAAIALLLRDFAVFYLNRLLERV